MTDVWVSTSGNSPLPAFAVHGGHDADGSPIYVGRSKHMGEILAAKVIPSKGCAYVSWGGHEHLKYQYEVLTGHGYGWVPQANGGIPQNAVATGYSGDGEPMYIGRGHHYGSLTVGKVHSSHRCLYIPFGRREVRLNCYEVLVRERVVTRHQAGMAFSPMFTIHDSDMVPEMYNSTKAFLNSMLSPKWP